MIAEIGTPCGSSALGDRAGLFRIGAVNRLFGCAALSPDPLYPGAPLPVEHPIDRFPIHAFPPDVTIGCHRDIGEDRIVLDHLHGVGI